MEKMSEKVMPVFQTLVGIRNKLQELRVSGCRHTMDDLRKYQQMLDSVDQKREAMGIFSGTMQAPGQAAFMEVLDDAYDILEQLVSTASELNPAMEHICKTLCGIQRKLSKMKQESPCSLDDLRHYQQMLNSIDTKRVDGIFAGSLKNNNVPAGQGLCVDVLSSCYELVDELKPVAREIDPELEKIMNELLMIKQELLDMKLHSLSSLHPLQMKLDEIDNSRVDGVFAGSLKSGRIPSGQAACANLLNECYQLVRELQIKYESEAPAVSGFEMQSMHQLAV